MPIPSLALAGILLAATPALQDGPEEPDSARAPLLSHAKLRRALARLVAEHPTLATLLGVGLSRAGDDEPLRIEAVRLAAGELGGGRPAILIVANVEGPTVYTSGIALDVARRLASGYESDERVRALLDSTTVYVVSRVNPAAAEARFAATVSERRATGEDADTDRDARLGEDPPQDVNGDGYVSVMRVPDPEGCWVEEPADPRILVEARRERGERGRWRLEPEGLDSDGDGEVAEDAPFDAEVDRNFPAGFEEHSPRSGPFATSEPEARALCEFVLGHPDVQLVLVYGERGGLADVGEGIPDDASDENRIPPAGLRHSDALLVAELARRYGEVVGDGGESQPEEDAGTFARWCYEHRGLLTLAIQPWTIPLDDDADPGEGEAGDEEQERVSTDARRLAWLEQQGVDAHLGWTPFEHPTLGPVEIGGFRPYALLEPPPAERARIADRQLEFLLGLGELLARVDLEEVAWRDLGGGLAEVSATVVNRGHLPLTSTWGQRTRTVRPAKVSLRLGSTVELVAGEAVQLVEELPGLGGRQELRWLVRNPTAGGVGVLVETDHAGTVRAVAGESR